MRSHRKHKDLVKPVYMHENIHTGCMFCHADCGVVGWIKEENQWVKTTSELSIICKLLVVKV